MPDFEPLIRSWREDALATGALHAWQVDELEDHLRAILQESGDKGSAESAWQSALEHLGTTSSITTEFNKDLAVTHLAKATGIVIVFALLAVCVNSGGGAVKFVHLPSLAIVLGLVSGGLIASFGPRRCWYALRASFAASSPLEPTEVEALGKVLRRGYWLSWASGALCGLLGMTQLLMLVPEPSLRGQGLAVVLLAPLYGALLAELLFAHCQQWLAGRQMLTSD